MQRHHIHFPPIDAQNLAQDEVWFDLVEDGEKQTIRLHDYGAIYKRPGLYEQLFYDRLKCQSPVKVAQILRDAVLQARENPSELRVLDLGAGNGMMGEALKRHGVARLVGVDIIPEAREAAGRDRPGMYDGYFVEDLCGLDPEKRAELQSWSLDCLVTVAALGFGDIPPRAFIEAFNLIRPGGWVALNIKDVFLHKRDTSGFSTLMRELLFSEFLDLHHLDRYIHRLSVEGKPLYYFAIAGRKRSDLTPEFLAQYGFHGF
jgi:SAM-dependent methyltransferase